MRKIIFATIFMFAGMFNPAHSAQIVNVEYIHNAIEQKWGITVPYNSALTNAKVVANMKYLLTAVDVANAKLGTTSNYGTGTYATLAAADTAATNTAVETLIKQGGPSWSFTTTPDTTQFSFSIGAAGNFEIDWGDGSPRQVLNRTDTEMTKYEHTYAAARAYKITLYGQATRYGVWGVDDAPVTIIFGDFDEEDEDGIPACRNLASISGGMGHVFPTLGDSGTNGTEPTFYVAFMGCRNLTSIPEDLFDGVTAYNSEYGGMSSMYGTFMGTGITTIPAKLFRGLSGTLAFVATFAMCDKLTSIPAGLFADKIVSEAAFTATFSMCTNLKSIPSGLFANLTGSSPHDMFTDTFNGCSSLTEIPAKLFPDIYGAGTRMFLRTFASCTSLKSIPSDLFAGMDGAPQSGTFTETFSGCTSLTGPSAKINGKYLYEIWPDATTTQVNKCYSGATGLTDYAQIPAAWK